MLPKMFIVIQRLTFCTIAITSTEISYWAKETAWVSTTTFQMFKDFCLYPGHSNISCTCFNSKIGFKVIGIDPDDVSLYEGSLIQNVGREREWRWSCFRHLTPLTAATVFFFIQFLWLQSRKLNDKIIPPLKLNHLSISLAKRHFVQWPVP